MIDKTMSPFKEIPTSGNSLLEVEKYRIVGAKMSNGFISSLAHFADTVSSLYQEGEKYFDPERMTKHEPTSCGIDLSEYIAMINDKEYECMICLFVDSEKKEVLAYDVSSCEARDHITTSATYGLLRFVFKECENIGNRRWLDHGRYGLINIHNHPGVIVAEPSSTDTVSVISWINLARYMGLSFLDSLVVSAYDCFSQLQYELDMREKGTPKDILLSTFAVDRKERRQADKRAAEEYDHCAAYLIDILQNDHPIAREQMKVEIERARKKRQQLKEIEKCDQK